MPSCSAAGGLGGSTAELAGCWDTFPGAYSRPLAARVSAASVPAQTFRRLPSIAAEAALRLLPMAARMKAECAEPDAQENRPALGNLAGSAAVIWGAYLEPVAVMHERVTRTDAGRLAVAETAAEPLWRLHSAAVQLVHFAASEGGAQLRALHPCLSQWPWYAANLSSTFQASKRGCWWGVRWSVHVCARGFACRAAG